MASHNHSLELKHSLKPYTCDGCKEVGFGPRYRCEKCNFDLHEHCMFPQLSPTSHEFFPKATFKFLTTPPEACHPHCKLRCDACRRPIDGYVYHCEEQDLDLHPCCRNLKQEYRIKDEDDNEVVFDLEKEVKGRCFRCNKKSIKKGDHSHGWCYISKCRNYHVHVACVTEMIVEQWKTLEGDSADQSLALQNLNLDLKVIQGKGKGQNGNKIWRTLKVLLSTIVSIVLGDPTMVFASLFLELLG